jgi:hypothetical protein
MHARHRLLTAGAVTLAGVVSMGVVAVACSAPKQAGPTPARCVGAKSPAPFEPPDGHTYLGVSSDHVAAWLAAAGVDDHPAVFGRWTTPDGPFSPVLEDPVIRAGAIPMIHWGLDLRGGRVSGGAVDDYLRAQADAVRAFAAPVFVRLDWEMNGFWYPKWSLPAVTPAAYVASWRHVVALFADVRNVAFVWAPNALDTSAGDGATHRTSEWYPGDDVVDWVGVDGYPQLDGSDVIGGADGLDDMARFAGAHHKPVVLSEWAPNLPNPDVVDPVDRVLDWAERYPHVVKALVYFDFAKDGKDFTLASHPVGAAELRARTADRNRYLSRVSTTLPSTGATISRCVKS